MRRLLSFMFLLCMLVVSSALWAQETRTISGVVISSEDDTPVPFASVYLKDKTHIGTQTDIDGKFILQKVPAGSNTLVVSFIGFEDAVIDISKGHFVRVIMKTDQVKLDEVVVTALGIQRQAKELGYATAKVTSEDLNAAKGTDATAALVGKVSGLQINITSPKLGSGISVTLRGARSFKGSNEAMLVLDGVPTPLEYLQTLNPNDIENISVLKGASAAALYGSSAANGVLYVTTKTGQRGKPRITYSLTTTFDKVSYWPKWQTRFGAGTSNSITGLPTDYISYENQQYGPEFDGSMVPIGEPVYDPNNPEGLQLMGKYSYIDEGRKGFWRTGVGIQNDISFSSSDERGSMFVSYQRVDQQGTVHEDNMVRQTIRFNANRKYKKVKVGAKMSYSNTHLDTNNNDQGGIYEVLQVPGNIDLRKYKEWNNPNVRGATQDEWFVNYAESPWFFNGNYRLDRRWDRVTAAIDAEYEILPWLKASARGGLGLGFSNSTSTNGAWHYSDWSKRSGNRSYASSDLYSSISTSSNMYCRLNIDAMLMAEHKINELFTIKGLLGYSLQETKSDYKGVEADRLEVDNFFNVKNKIGELSGSNSIGHSRKIGVFGSIDLAFKNWAFLQVTGRNDWTSLLDPSNRSFFYPGANASIMLNEAIRQLRESDVLSYLKLRGTFARVGTVNIGNYNLDDLANPITDYFPYGTLGGYALSTNIRNRMIEPEFTTEFEVGAEIGLFRDRIQFEAAFYNQKTDNQTVNISIPHSTGYSTKYINAGTMRGRGVELDLRITPLLQLGDFRWNINANATFLSTKVMELADGVDELNIESAIYAIKGEPFPTIKATDYKRSPDGKVLIDPRTGYPLSGDLKIIGGTQPKVRLGLSSTFKWKGFTLTGTFDYRGGHHTRFDAEYNMLFFGASQVSTVAGRQRFVYPNSAYEVTDANGNVSYKDNTNITVQDGNKYLWDGPYKSIVANRVVSAASWRLRELSLAYEVPEKVLRKTKVLQRASVSLVGRNLFMWLPDTNIWGDPDFNASDVYNATGISSIRTPGSRNFGFNVLVSF